MSSLSSNSSSSNLGNAVYAITSILLAIATIAVVLRCYVRLVMGKNFGLDDGSIVFTVILLIVGDVCVFYMLEAGMGRHLPSLASPEESALKIVKWNTIYQPINIIGALFTKISIGLFILRLQNTRKFIFAIWMVLTPLALITVILSLIVWLQCRPLRALWTPTLNGHCISSEIPLNVSYIQSGFAIIADLFLTISPIAILWNIKISSKKKVAICGLMSLGLMATIANALRNAFIPNLKASDISYTIVPVIVVADLEFSLGVIAACMPTLMPLFRTREKNSSTYGNASGRYSKSNAGRDYPRRIPSNDLELSQGYTISEAHFQHSSNGTLPFTHGDGEIKIPSSKTWKVEYSPA